MRRAVLIDELTNEVPEIPNFLNGFEARGVPEPKNNVSGIDPTASNDSTQGYSIGSRWTNTALGGVWFCTDDSPGAAVWNDSSAGGAGDMLASVYDPTNINANAFARANHTGTQPASTISDFDTEVGNHPDVSANTADRHTHANKAQLDLVTDGDHDVRTDNPHSVNGNQLLSGAEIAGQILEANGVGGVVWATPSASSHTHVRADITDLDPRIVDKDADGVDSGMILGVAGGVNTYLDEDFESGFGTLLTYADPATWSLVTNPDGAGQVAYVNIGFWNDNLTYLHKSLTVDPSWTGLSFKAKVRMGGVQPYSDLNIEIFGDAGATQLVVRLGVEIWHSGSAKGFFTEAAGMTQVTNITGNLGDSAQDTWYELELKDFNLAAGSYTVGINGVYYPQTGATGMLALVTSTPTIRVGVDANNPMSDFWVDDVLLETNIAVSYTPVYDVVDTIGTPGLDTNIPSEQAVREELNNRLPRTLELESETGSYSLVAADNGKLKTIDNALTIPTGLPVGFQCKVFLDNVAAQTLTTTGLTVKGNDANTNISGNGIITLTVIAVDTILIAGEMEV